MPPHVQERGARPRLRTKRQTTDPVWDQPGASPRVSDTALGGNGAAGQPSALFPGLGPTRRDPFDFVGSRWKASFSSVSLFPEVGSPEIPTSSRFGPRFFSPDNHAGLMPSNFPPSLTAFWTQIKDGLWSVQTHTGGLVYRFVTAQERSAHQAPPPCINLSLLDPPPFTLQTVASFSPQTAVRPQSRMAWCRFEPSRRAPKEAPTVRSARQAPPPTVTFPVTEIAHVLRVAVVYDRQCDSSFIKVFPTPHPLIAFESRKESPLSPLDG